MTAERMIPRSAAVPDRVVRILYRNHRAETAVRTVTPFHVWHGTTPWHPEPQWLLDAWDHEKGAPRTFALCDVLRWGVPLAAPDAPAG